MKTLKQAYFQYAPITLAAEKLLISAASLAGRVAAIYASLSQTMVGEVARVVAFLALGSVLLCSTEIGWWLLGAWADGVTLLVLYAQGLM